jgi:hypothetical protein
MARILLSAIVTSIRGKIGGTVFQNSYTSFQAKNFNRVHDPRRPIQSQRRNTFGHLSNAWNQLGDSDRGSWNEFKDPGLSGYNTFVRVNTQLASVGEPMQSNYFDDSPPVTMFIALIVLTASNISIQATGLTTTVPADCIVSIRLARAVSPGTSFLPAGALVQLITYPAGTDLSVNQNLTTAYTAARGPLTAGQRVFVQALVINIINGRSSLGQRNSGIIAP